MSWKYELVSNLESLADEWSSLIESGECSHVFFHPAMVKAWIETYKPLRKIEPFVIKAIEGDNVALLPMALWHKNWKNAFQKAVVPIGYSDFDYHDPIFSYRPSEKSLAGYWKGVIKVINDNFKYDTLTTDGITDSLTAPGLDWRQGEICPLLNLNDIHSEEELMVFFKTSLRGDIRRQMRRLEEFGSLKLTEYHSFNEISQETFTKFMEQHTLRWPSAYKAPRFHENLLRYGLTAGVVHFSVLTAGEHEIAWHLGFTHRRRYYYYMPVGNQDYFKYSPTKIHLFFLVRRAVEMGYTVYDHLRGEENYKSGWSNDSQNVNTITMESPSISAALKRNALKIRSILPPPLRI